MAEIDYNQYDAGFKEYLKQNPMGIKAAGMQQTYYPGGYYTGDTETTKAFNKYLGTIGVPVPANTTAQYQIQNKVGPPGPTVTSLNPSPSTASLAAGIDRSSGEIDFPAFVPIRLDPPQQVAQPQPQPQQVVQPVSQAEPTDIKQQMEQQAGQTGVPQAPAGTVITPAAVSLQGTEQVAPAPIQQIETPVAQTADVLEVTPPIKEAAAKYEAYVAPGTPEATAVQGRLSSEAVIGDIQGAVSEGSIAQAATGQVDERSTVKYQLGELYKSFEEGREPPAWASPAIRAITSQMQARGLGASSMAAAAITQAVLEAGVPIAKSDADRYGAIQLTNLNNQQQAALQNATVFAAMDKANLDARMSAAANNAKSFLTMDTQNLTGDQRRSEISYQGELQKLFTDSAAQNASRNFNAESQAQVDQFYAQLDVSVEAANANRRAAQQQFNVNESNAMRQFVSNLESQRQQFNANMQAQIDQSNAVWRRQANTADTQAINEANRINAQNLFNMNAQAQNNLWNEYRDKITWAMQTAENTLERQHQLTVAAMEADANSDLYDKEMMFNAAAGVGGLVGRILKDKFNQPETGVN